VQAIRLPLQRFFGLTQYDDLANQIAEMRFRVSCGERVASDKYCLDDLLPQMAASFQHRAEAFGACP
jgi:hypothetical protein